MRIDIMTLFPEIFASHFDYSIIKRAIKKEKVIINVHNIRDYSTSKHKQADDYQYGGGSGMVMMAEPISNCIEHILKEINTKPDEIIYLTPEGETFKQKEANYLSTLENIIILCGHYKGIDERIRELYITREISTGDYVLTGGELPALIVCDAVVRLLPGVLSDETSALSDSFQDNLLSAPVYTRPAEFKGMKVPDVLLSGNEKEIYEWRMNESIKKTKQKRPDLLEND